MRIGGLEPAADTIDVAADDAGVSRVRYSVIVPAFNAGVTLEDCLRGLFEQTVARDLYEVIVVDDGSTDDTVTIAERFPVRLLRQKQSGPAVARNLGARAALGCFLLFTDADCEPTPIWLAEIVAPLDADTEIAGVKGAYRTRQTSLIARFCQVEFEVKYAGLRRRRFIDFVDTYSAAFRKDAFWGAGGFDPSYPLPTVEDAELAYNLAAQGHRLVFAERAVVYHRHPESLWRYAFRKWRFGFWRVRVYQRHPNKLAGDSNTPRSTQAQMAFACLSVVLAPFPETRWLAGAALVTFGLATAPFVRQAWSGGRIVAAIVPPLMYIRALALGTGLLTGVVALQLQRFWPRASIGHVAEPRT